jgi:hypothetical protein
LWRSTANCNQVIQQQQQQQNDLDVIDLMTLMEENSGSFQQPIQTVSQNILEPPPAYPGTPDVKRSHDDFLMDDEGRLCIFSAPIKIIFPNDREERAFLKQRLKI